MDAPLRIRRSHREFIFVFGRLQRGDTTVLKIYLPWLLQNKVEKKRDIELVCLFISFGFFDLIFSFFFLF
ncbi:MAG: hypothetical protein Q8P67_07530, partial [archaeon]|nr:hypothetical protein [archaeon]